MARLTITQDRQDGVVRCAVWQDKELIDLFVNRVRKPDLSGAIVLGKVVRTAQSGTVAWVDANLEEKIYLESKKPVKAGSWLMVGVQATMGQGKAWVARHYEVVEHPGSQKPGVVMPPPQPWERAMNSLREKDTASFVFQDREDYDAFTKAGIKANAKLVVRESVHPDLDDTIDALLDPVVSLKGGGSLVIEQTEALVAIDVNAPDASHPATTNLAAVREAARQIRLRNLSGIIVIDCLKMKQRADASKVVNAFTRVSDLDPLKVDCFGVSKIGLLEVTRMRTGPSLAEIIKR